MQQPDLAPAKRPPMKTILLGLIMTLAPAATLLWLAGDPARNRTLLLTSEHFMVVTLVSLLALGISWMVAREARQHAQYQVLLMSLGFMCVAGFFAVHALATPGMLLPSPAEISDAKPSGSTSSGGGFRDYGTNGGYNSFAGTGSQTDTTTPSAAPEFGYDGTIIGLSATLSLFVPSLFFAASHAPVARRIRERLPIPAGGLVVLITLALTGYGYLAGWHSEWLSALPISFPPESDWLAVITVVLLLFTAWQQMRIYLRTRFPMQAALAVAFVLLAEAQVVMALGPFWTLTWWGYHLLMLAAVILALGALFLELDRRRGLERFLPNEVVERIVTGDLVRLGGERRTVTVLFADLRGSTSLAEHLPAEAVVELLNDYVGCMARAVFDHGGMVDKYLGDGLMAVFGVIPDESDGADHAVAAALTMRREMAKLNARRVAAGGSEIGFGVGMHSGEVVLGTVGIPQRQDFTAIGDAVNTAARIEALSKEYGVDITLSEQCTERLAASGPVPRELGSSAIRGREGAIGIYTID